MVSLNLLLMNLENNRPFDGYAKLPRDVKSKQVGYDSDFASED